MPDFESGKFACHRQDRGLRICDIAFHFSLHRADKRVERMTRAFDD